MNTKIEFITDLARKYANVCEFKSDFPHDYNSVKDGFIEGFKVAERLLSELTTKDNTNEANLTIPVVSNRRELLIAVFEKMNRPQITMLEIGDYDKLADELLSNL